MCRTTPPPLGTCVSSENCRVRESNETNRLGRDVSTTHTRSSSRHRSEEHTSELQSRGHLVCRLLPEKKTEHVSCPTTRTRSSSSDYSLPSGCGRRGRLRATGSL